MLTDTIFLYGTLSIIYFLNTAQHKHLNFWTLSIELFSDTGHHRNSDLLRYA